MIEDHNSSGWQSVDIYLFTNGQEHSPPRKYHLTSEQLESWDDTLQQLAALHYGSQNSHIEMYMLDGKQIENPMQLKHGESYVAVEQNDIFVPAEYKQYLMRASRSWEKSQANKNLKDAVLYKGAFPEPLNNKQVSNPEIVTIPLDEPLDEVIKNQLLLEIQESYLYDYFGNKNFKLQNYLLVNNTRHEPNFQVNKVNNKSISKTKLSTNKINKAKSLKGISKHYKTSTELKTYTSDISGIKQSTNNRKSKLLQQNTTGQKPTYQFITNNKNKNKTDINETINGSNYIKSNQMKSKIIEKNDTYVKNETKMDTGNKIHSNFCDKNKNNFMPSGIKRNKTYQKSNNSKNFIQTNNSKLIDEDINISNKIIAEHENNKVLDSEQNDLSNISKNNFNIASSEQLGKYKNCDEVITNYINKDEINNINIPENIQDDKKNLYNKTNDACFEKENNILSTTNNKINAIINKGDLINIQLNYKGDKIEGIIIIEKEKENVPRSIDILNLDKPLHTNINILFSDELNNINENNKRDNHNTQLVEEFKNNENFNSKLCDNKFQTEDVCVTDNSDINCRNAEDRLIVALNKNASTQTDWNNTLLVPIRTEHNELAFTLPPLELIKNYF